MIKDFNIMDVTCRDGSYVNNFQISTQTQKNIGIGLENLGIKYFEIGHGMGIGAYRESNRKSLHTDLEYLQCAQENTNTIKYGVFCIPGVAVLDDIKIAADYGCSFIRIGSNVEDIDKTEDFIKEAKKQGLYVMSNYMKSYASTVNEFKEAVKKSESWGSELIYIVDSAGGMLPKDIETYYSAIRDVSDLDIGFHGHDNIGMALSNSIYALDLGIDFIDCSLQGLGRSAGNTSLEYMMIYLSKAGYDINIDLIEMLLLSKKYVYPLVKQKGINPIDVECGIAGFHSSYLQDIHKVSAKYEVNPLRLIEEYSKVDRVNMDIVIAEEIAKRLCKEPESSYLMNFNDYFGCEQQS